MWIEKTSKKILDRNSELLKKTYYAQSLFWGFFWAVCWSLTERQFRIDNIVRRYWVIAFGKRRKPSRRTLGSLFEEISVELLKQGYNRNGLPELTKDEFSGFLPDWDGWETQQKMVVDIRPRLINFFKPETSKKRGGGFLPP